MAKGKMTTCKHCGAEIAASAKVCPHCGGKNKPPIYKRWWFILIVVLVILSYLGSSGSSSSSSASSGQKTNNVTSSKPDSSTPTSVSSSSSDSASDDIATFAKENGVSVELASELDKIVKDTEIASSVNEIVNWNRTDDWANGERYNARIDGLYIQVDTIGNKVYSIKNTTNDEVDRFIYKDETAGKAEEAPDDGSILLSDGILGEYGKEATTKSGYKYVRYTIPAGTYTVEGKIKGSTVFVVSDSNSEDVSAYIQLTNVGEKQSVTIKSGYHIELSENAEVLLTPVQ